MQSHGRRCQWHQCHQLQLKYTRWTLWTSESLFNSSLVHLSLSPRSCLIISLFKLSQVVLLLPLMLQHHPHQFLLTGTKISNLNYLGWKLRRSILVMEQWHQVFWTWVCHHLLLIVTGVFSLSWAQELWPAWNQEGFFRPFRIWSNYFVGTTRFDTLFTWYNYSLTQTYRYMCQIR